MLSATFTSVYLGMCLGLGMRYTYWSLVLQVPNDAPLWMQNSQLCFYWTPTRPGDLSQCGGRRTICARAGQWTDYYRDDTNSKVGGCKLSWGLLTHWA